MDKHLTRKELLKAARKEVFYKHLEDCPECREAVELLAEFSVAGNIPLENPPEGWIAKAVAIADSGSQTRKKRLAKLVFDSWAVARPVGVRGSTSVMDRRLRFESKELLFDLRAEKKKSGWSFIAQVHSLGGRFKHSRIQVGRDIIDQDAAGIFQWSSPRPPKRIHLLVNDSSIEIPEILWRKNPK